MLAPPGTAGTSPSRSSSASSPPAPRSRSPSGSSTRPSSPPELAPGRGCRCGGRGVGRPWRLCRLFVAERGDGFEPGGEPGWVDGADEADGEGEGESPGEHAEGHLRGHEGGEAGAACEEAGGGEAEAEACCEREQAD